MNKTGDNMEKRIRSVKTWLDKAEQAYADDSATKGQLQLMLAQAEMQHLNEKRAPALWQRLGYWSIAVGLALLVGGGYYAWQHQGDVKNTAPVMEEQSQPMSETPHSNMPAVSQTLTNSVDAPNSTTNTTGGTVNASAETATADTNQNVEAVTTQADNAVATPQATEEAVRTATPESQTSESVAAPVISTTQIQEAVREGGRSLRGQEQ